MSLLGERVLSALARDPATQDNAGGTARTNLHNALDFLTFTIPDFLSRIAGQTVLDFGCGHGWQALALARAGAQSVTGVDIRLANALKNLSKHPTPNVAFLEKVPANCTFDVTLSCSSFEHFSDPEEILALMQQYTRSGGLLIISFAEPWLSPYGSHMFGITRFPWVNVLFSEQTVMKVRAKYRHDGARHYEEVEGGLNRMTLARFERIIRNSGLHIEFLKYYPTKNLPVVAHVPLVREFLVSSAGCILRKPA
jgi:2-polyprenyl-3-methyl-5-hydroxy-6-metoxy-1,4-benzoquinol methylase